MALKSKQRSSWFDKLVIFLLYWVVLQDFVLSFGYQMIPVAALFKALLYLKDIIMLGLFLFVLLFNRLPIKYFYALLSFLLCLCISSVLALIKNQTAVMVIFQNVRSVILLPAFISIGYSIHDREAFKKHLYKKYFPFLVFCAAVAIVEYVLDDLVGTKDFWLEIMGIDRFYIDIKDQADRLVYGFPGNFYGAYGNEFFSVKRLVGFWMGPLTAAYALIIPACYYAFRAFYQFRKRKDENNPGQLMRSILSTVVLVVAIYLTHTRAIILLAGFLFILYLMMHRTKKTNVLLIFVLLIGVLFMILKWDAIHMMLFDGSTAEHIRSMRESFSNFSLTIFGDGLGSYGIYGEKGTESALLSLYGNMGFAGLLLYLYCLLYPIILSTKNRKFSILTKLVVWCSVCYILSGFISEQLFAFTAIAPYYTLLGLTFKEGVVEKQSVKSKQVVQKLKFAENKWDDTNAYRN